MHWPAVGTTLAEVLTLWASSPHVLGPGSRPSLSCTNRRSVPLRCINTLPFCQAVSGRSAMALGEHVRVPRQEVARAGGRVRMRGKGLAYAGIRVGG